MRDKSEIASRALCLSLMLVGAEITARSQISQMSITDNLPSVTANAPQPDIREEE